MVTITKGKHDTGEEYTEYGMRGKRTKIVVQSTGMRSGKPHWFIYKITPNSARTLGSKTNRKEAEIFATGYIKGAWK